MKICIATALLFVIWSGATKGLKYTRSPEDALAYLKRVTADGYVPVGEVVQHTDLNGTETYSDGAVGTAREIEEVTLDRVSEDEEAWVITITSLFDGKDQVGPLNTASVITISQVVYFEGEDAVWLQEGDGVAFDRGNGSEYREVGRITISGSGHEDVEESNGNFSTILSEVYAVDDVDGEKSAVNVFGVYELEYLEESLETEGYETIVPGKLYNKRKLNQNKLPMQVNEVRETEPLPEEAGKVTENAEGTLFIEKEELEDITYTYAAEGERSYTDEITTKRPHIRAMFRRQIRSAISYIHKRR